MSAYSGIGVSQGLIDHFSSAVESKSTRFLIISIQNESLVHDRSVPVSGSFEKDLEQLAGLVEDDVPAYILARLDEPTSEWLSIAYVPDSAKVRDKMVYASSRASLTKALGSAHFTDSLFATDKGDLTPAAYAAHRAHLSAPKPLSARERELEAVQTAVREGGRTRVNHVGSEVGYGWGADVEDAVAGVAGEQDGPGKLVVLSIEPGSETLKVASTTEVSMQQLGSSLPSSEPSFAFYSWSRVPSRREIVFIYCCPSSSPIKHRMLYSSGCLFVYRKAQSLFSSMPDVYLASRKIETSDPTELNERDLVAELGLDGAREERLSTPSGQGTEEKGFARPKGPVRRMR